MSIHDTHFAQRSQSLDPRIIHCPTVGTNSCRLQYMTQTMIKHMIELKASQTLQVQTGENFKLGSSKPQQLLPKNTRIDFNDIEGIGILDHSKYTVDQTPAAGRVHIRLHVEIYLVVQIPAEVLWSFKLGGCSHQCRTFSIFTSSQYMYV